VAALSGAAPAIRTAEGKWRASAAGRGAGGTSSVERVVEFPDRACLGLGESDHGDRWVDQALAGPGARAALRAVRYRPAG